MGGSLILLVAIIEMVKSYQYVNTPIDSPPGIYFEGINRVRMTKGEWNILTSLNIADIHRHGEPMSLVLSNYSELCHKIIYECRPFYLKSHQWSLADEDMESRWKQIRDFIHPLETISNNKYQSSSMTKEEQSFLNNALPYVSSIQRTDFDRQTTHIPSGLKQLVETLDTRKREIRKNIKNLSELTKLTPNEAINRFSDITESADNIVHLRSQFYTILTEVITSIKSGQLHPSTFIPEELRKTFKIISNQRQDAILPLLSDELGLTMIKEVAKTKILVKENTIIIVLTIPLVERNDSILYFLHPHPVIQRIGQKTTIFAQIDGTSNYLIINDDNQEYALPSSEYLGESCETNSQYLICHPTLIFHPINNNSHCEISLLQNITPRNCDIRISSYKRNRWIALTKTSGWLYSLTKPIMGQLTCRYHSTEKIVLSGSGKLTLNQNCRLTLHDLVLTTPNTTFNRSIPSDIIPNQTLILNKIYPEINYYENLFQFDERSGFTNEVPLTFILRTITQKLYYDHKTFKIVESDWNWKIIILIFLIINCSIYLIKLAKSIYEHESSKHQSVKHNLSTIPEEASLIPNNPPLPVKNQSLNIITPVEVHYKIPPKPIPIPIPALNFQGPTESSNVVRTFKKKGNLHNGSCNTVDSTVNSNFT